jgi:hypothetical protein
MYFEFPQVLNGQFNNQELTRVSFSADHLHILHMVLTPLGFIYVCQLDTLLAEYFSYK